MPKKPRTHRPPGYKGPTVTKREAARKQREKPGGAWYNTARWKKLRAIVLAASPYCTRCEADGIVTPSDTVNHRVPHKGDFELFWDMENLEAVCKSCHSRTIQREEAEADSRGSHNR